MAELNLNHLSTFHQKVFKIYSGHSRQKIKTKNRSEQANKRLYTG